MTFTGYRWSYLESMKDGPLYTRAHLLLQSVDWNSLLEYAVTTRNGVSCSLLPQIGLGYNNMVQLLEFEDGIRWVARLRMPSVNKHDIDLVRQQMELEYNTALLVRAKTTIPVPKIHTVETTADNFVNAPFMLMDCLSGNVAMDLGMALPPQYKQKFIEQMADIHTQLSSTKLPKIGTFLGMNDDGSYKQGPLPGLGGPFDTVADYLSAWVEKIQFPHAEDKIRAMSGPFADEIVSGVALFKEGIKTLANDPSFSVSNQGPFPLCHGDFGHNNIIVNDEYDVLGVIDWEMSYAGPWEVFGDFPLTLSTTPPVMDAPWNYDEQGKPKDEELQAVFDDQKKYIEAVRNAERRFGIDRGLCLSMMLGDSKMSQLVAGMRLYKDGKTGFYNQLMKQFERAH